MSCNLDEHFSAEDKHLLREQFIGNELDSDQYRDAWPEAGLHYLTTLGIPLVRGNGLDDTEALLSALLTWLQAWDAEGRGNYAGADAAREFLTIVFEDRGKPGETPYDDDLHDIKLYLAELKS